MDNLTKPSVEGNQAGNPSLVFKKIPKKDIANIRGRWRELMKDCNRHKIEKIKQTNPQQFDAIKNHMNGIIKPEINRYIYENHGNLSNIIGNNEDQTINDNININADRGHISHIKTQSSDIFPSDCVSNQLIVEFGIKLSLQIRLEHYRAIFDDLKLALQSFFDTLNIVQIIENLINCVESILESLLSGLLDRIIGGYLLVILFICIIALVILYLSKVISLSSLVLGVVGVILLVILFGALLYVVILAFLLNEKERLISCFRIGLDSLTNNFCEAVSGALTEYINA
ncbi:MAG: glycerol-3-phosphate acyltransferase [Bacteroidetes bacterium]|nr:glycerol-3-phosphate acyltransferase [Bacteroidota bacterium]